MSAFIDRAQTPLLAKIDNDVMVPPHWLGESLVVVDRHPELSLLGLEAFHPIVAAPDPDRGYAPADFVSKLGLYRRAAFAASQPVPSQRWYGFAAWQPAQGSRLVRGWINPALPIFLLDRLPFVPWADLTAEYVGVAGNGPGRCTIRRAPAGHGTCRPRRVGHPRSSRLSRRWPCPSPGPAVIPACSARCGSRTKPPT
jgi:hypothetical protein